MGTVAAREHVRIAKALAGLPLVDAAMGEGTLSYSKVRAITRVANEHNEQRLVEMAQCSTAAQPETICRHYRHIKNRSNTDGIRTERYFHHWETEDGMVRIEAQMTLEEFAQFQLALGLAKEPCESESTENVSAESANTPTAEPLPRPNNVDALMNLAETYLARGAASRSAAERAQLFIHFKQDPLGPTGQWGVFLEDGSRVPAETFRRLTSDISFDVHRHSPLKGSRCKASEGVQLGKGAYGATALPFCQPCIF